MTDFEPKRRVAYETIDEDEISLVRDLVVSLSIGEVEIRAPYRSDGATIPPFAWSILSLHPLDPVGIRGFITHDGLYGAKACSKREADRAMYDVNIEDGMPKWKARILFFVVSILGHQFYNRKEEQAHLVTLTRHETTY